MSTMTSTDPYVDKYLPKNSKDIVGNTIIINRIKAWIANFDKEDTACILITGKHGIGKTTIAHLVLEEYGYTVSHVNFTLLNEIIDNGSGVVGKEIDKYVQKFDKRKELFRCAKQAYIIDNISSISSRIDKDILTALKKYNQKYHKFPLIFVSDDQHNKLVNEIKKTIIEYHLENPEDRELIEYIKKICKSESICIDKKIYESIILHAQYDIRRLLNILQSLQDIYGTDKIGISEFDAFQQCSKQKDTYISLYDITDELFNQYSGIDKSLSLFEQDRGLVPLFMHQNYFSYIKAKINPEEQLLVLKNIADNLSMGDVTEGHIYRNQVWGLHEICGYYMTTVPSYELNHFNGKEREKKNNKIDGLSPRYKYEFPKDLNKTSIKNINKRNITNVVDTLNKTVIDYIYLNQIINKFIEDKEFIKIGKLLNHYNIDIKELGYLLKIDKIKNSKFSIPEDIKQKIMKYLH